VRVQGIGLLVCWFVGLLAEEDMRGTDESYCGSYASTHPKHCLYFSHDFQEEDKEDERIDCYQR